MIEINGVNFFGSNINICNGKVIIDGKDVTNDFGNITNNTINVVFSGDLCNLTSDGNVEVNGNITGKVEVDGEVRRYLVIAGIA